MLGLPLKSALTASDLTGETDRGKVFAQLEGEYKRLSRAGLINCNVRMRHGQIVVIEIG